MPVDEDFFATLDKWRVDLATDIVRSNKGVTEDDLNRVVHQTIQRTIFLKMAEAKVGAWPASFASGVARCCRWRESAEGRGFAHVRHHRR